MICRPFRFPGQAAPAEPLPRFPPLSWPNKPPIDRAVPRKPLAPQPSANPVPAEFGDEGAA